MKRGCPRRLAPCFRSRMTRGSRMTRAGEAGHALGRLRPRHGSGTGRERITYCDFGLGLRSDGQRLARVGEELLRVLGVQVRASRYGWGRMACGEREQRAWGSIVRRAGPAWLAVRARR